MDYKNYNPRAAALAQARTLLTDAVKAAVADGTLPEAALPDFIVEIPADVKNGDIASNVAMAGARAFHKAPRQIAEAITAKLQLDGSLFDRLSLAGGKLILSTLEKAEVGILHPVKQDEAEATHVTMLDKSMGQIDWSMDAAVIERLIRGLNPWPSAYTKFEGKTLKIWSADVEEDAAGRPSPETFGQVVRVGKDAFSVQTGKGLLTIRELQLEGKKRMDTAAFLRGYPVETGVKLG